MTLPVVWSTEVNDAITKGAWNQMIDRLNTLKELAEEAHKLRCEGALDLEEPYLAYMGEYYRELNLMALTHPDNLQMALQASRQELEQLSADIELLFGLGETSEESVADLAQMLGRQIRLLDFIGVAEGLLARAKAIGKPSPLSPKPLPPARPAEAPVPAPRVQYEPVILIRKGKILPNAPMPTTPFSGGIEASAVDNDHPSPERPSPQATKHAPGSISLVQSPEKVDQETKRADKQSKLL